MKLKTFYPSPEQSSHLILKTHLTPLKILNFFFLKFIFFFCLFTLRIMPVNLWGRWVEIIEIYLFFLFFKVSSFLVSDIEFFCYSSFSVFISTLKWIWITWLLKKLMTTVNWIYFLSCVYVCVYVCACVVAPNDIKMELYINDLALLCFISLERSFKEGSNVV